MRRLPTSLVVFLAALSPAVFAQSGMRDRYFNRYPFDKWKTEGSIYQIKWVPKILPAKLSPHQRLLTRIEFAIDGREAEKRRGRGELVIFVEIADSTGRHWRTHQIFDLTRIPEGAKAQQIRYAQDVFVVPGDYTLALAICDSQTLDHSFAERSLHVPPLHADPLPEASRDLPAVEYVREFQPPDNWYQPYLRGRLHLALETSRPVHLDVVVNMTPSERVSGSVRNFRRNMSVLVPSLKIISGITLSNGTLDVTLLDLTGRRMWEQLNAHQLDWFRMREPFATVNPGVIDVQSLATRAEMLQFLREQVTGKLQAHDDDGQLRAVIVLSAPVFFGQQAKADVRRATRDPNQRLYYLRYRPLPPAQIRYDAMGGSVLPLANSLPSDDIEHVMKALDGRLFSVIGPEEFRRALAAILSDISRL